MAAFAASKGDDVTEEPHWQTRRIVLGALSAVVLVLVGVFFLPDPAGDPAPAVQPEPAVAPVVADAPPVAPALEAPVGPQFDTFRMETDGAMLIAGRAAPDQDVDVILGGVAIMRVTADATGTFVTFAQAAPSEVPRRLSLLGDPDGAAVLSTTSYMVAPVRPPQVAQPALPQAPVAPPAVSQADAPPATPQPDAAPAEVAGLPDPVPDAQPEVPTVLQTGPDGISVAQAAPQQVPNVALDAITYDPEGDIVLSGRATGDGAMQLYLDNRPVTTSPVTEGGAWRIDLPDVATGVYNLRIDEVDSAGTVVSRIETPFKREQASDVAAVLAEETARGGFEVAVRTVQPGATLWAIAEENLGKGIYYVEVFEANRDLIRDPDLIYPGQIFRIPAAPE